MRVHLTLDSGTLKALVLDYVRGKFVSENIETGDIKIETKSKQNYKSEWEIAEFRAVVDKEI